MGRDTASYSREVALLEHYERHPVYYSPLAYRGYFTALCEALDFEPDTRRVLDLGCGDGRLLHHIAPGTYTGIDYSPTRVGVAGGLWPQHTFMVADVYKYLDTYQADPFTLTVAVETLEHLENPMRVIDAALQVSDAVVGTVPVDMPYEAHLQVFETVDDVDTQLEPDRVVRLGKHWGVLWER